MTKKGKPGSLLEALDRYAAQVKAGADPIEAMGGHLCGPHCLHWERMSEEERAKVSQAPWNQKGR